ADETYLPFAPSPEANVERLRFISSLHIEPSVFCYAFNAPPIFTPSRRFSEVKMANTFSHVRSQDPDAFVARRSASSPPKIIKVISSSKQQESEAVRPEANQGGVAPIKAASAGHVASSVSKPTAAASATTASSAIYKKAGKHDGRKRLRGEKRFLTTWPSKWLSTIAEEVQPQIIAEKVHPKRYL
ncbi:unnamed protein product, partial [Polarella glacialis]